MKTSLNWLKRYLDIDLPVEEISDILTTIGLEVEGVEEVEMVKGGLRGVVVGEVLTCQKHPDADKLSITTVDIGRSEPIQVVCGAPNVAKGQKVPVATIGTILYNGDEPWKIKKGKIRGQVSEGMICAEDELGLGSGHDGIMVLDSEAKIGIPASEHFGIKSDIVFDIGLTPNRSDATSHTGVAKDLVAYLKVNKSYHGDIKYPDLSAFNVLQQSRSFDIVIEDKEACPRYSGITLNDIKVGESPQWIKEHLLSIGVRPINNVVDITNFVLHEMGQPLHAFDADKISGQKVIIRKARQGEKFVTLDEVERTLTGDDLLICDADKKPLCMAGVFGGLDSGVSDDTTSIFLESAYFDASTIRKTSMNHLLRTDAAKVFEKGADPSKTIKALKRAVLLLEKYAGATIVSDIIDVYPKSIDPVEVVLYYEKLKKYIGTDISKDEVHMILRALDMEIKPVNDESCKVYVSTDRADVTREVDVIEEILRIYGFNKVPIPSKVTSTLNFEQYPTKNVVKETIANFLSALDYNEMMGLSLIESKLVKELLPIENDRLVYINNTSNIHLDIMRPDMLISGLASVKNNHNRQQINLRLYEFGKTYLKEGEDYLENEYLAIFISGQKNDELWSKDFKQEVDFFDIKEAVHSVFSRIGLDGYQISDTDFPGLAYGLRYHRGNKVLADFGEVSQSIIAKMGLKTSVFFALIPVDVMTQAAQKTNIKIREIGKYPSMRRDLALVLDKNVSYKEIIDISRKIEKKLLKNINIFDVYDNEDHLGKGKKSYAVSFYFEDYSKTLNDKAVDKIMSKLIAGFEQQLGATIRK